MSKADSETLCQLKDHGPKRQEALLPCSQPTAGSLAYDNAALEKAKQRLLSGNNTLALPSLYQQTQPATSTSTSNSLEPLVRHQSSETVLVSAPRFSPPFVKPPTQEAAHDSGKVADLISRPESFYPVKPPRSNGDAEFHALTKQAVFDQFHMCRLCSRAAAVEGNQIVICRCCGSPWHQFCADPKIPDAAIADHFPWICSKCHVCKIAHVGGPTDGLVPWATSREQKLAYLSTVPQPLLVALAMKALDKYPTLSLFPKANEAASYLSMHGSTNRPDNLKLEPTFMDESNPAAWPKNGWIHDELDCGKQAAFLEEPDDFESFSVARFNAKGEKLWENGVFAGPTPNQGFLAT